MKNLAAKMDFDKIFFTLLLILSSLVNTEQACTTKCNTLLKNYNTCKNLKRKISRNDQKVSENEARELFIQRKLEDFPTFDMKMELFHNIFLEIKSCNDTLNSYCKCLKEIDSTDYMNYFTNKANFENLKTIILNFKEKNAIYEQTLNSCQNDEMEMFCLKNEFYLSESYPKLSKCAPLNFNISDCNIEKDFYLNNTNYKTLANCLTPVNHNCNLQAKRLFLFEKILIDNRIEVNGDLIENIDKIIDHNDFKILNQQAIDLFWINNGFLIFGIVTILVTFRWAKKN